MPIAFRAMALDAYRSDLAAAGVVTFGPEEGRWLLLADLLEKLAQTRTSVGPGASRSGRRGARPPHALGAATADGDLGGDARERAGPRDGARADGLLKVLRHVLTGSDVPAADTGQVSAGAAPLRSARARGKTEAPNIVSPNRPRSTPDSGGQANAYRRDASSVLREAEAMEEHGALRLAHAVLAAAAAALPRAPRATLGLALAQRARIARKLGDLTYAQDLYAEAARVARVARAPDVVIRASLGMGVVARVRGNYPEARAHFRRGLRAARRAGVPDLESVAHHGLLLAAAAAGDLETALQHGWAALRLAGGDANREADLLVNLAAVAGDAGDHAAAVRGYLAAASRVREQRVRLPALGGAALSAAWLADVTLVRRLTTLIESEIEACNLPYEQAHVCVLLAEAWQRAGSPLDANEYADRARALVLRHDFHEVAHALDRVARGGTASRSERLRSTPGTGAATPGALRTGSRRPRHAAGLLRELAAVPLGAELPETATFAPV